MANIVISGDSSGSVTLSAPAVSGTTVLTLPTTSGTLVVTGGAQTVQFAAGSAAAPSITFTGDTNTGIFSPGADSIGFTEGGAEIARFDSSGTFIVGPFGGNGNAVVAGSSSPSFTNQPGTNLLLKSGDGSGTGASFMSFSTSPAGSSGTTVNTAVERMRIDSSGRVGIGVSPTVPLDLSSSLSARTVQINSTSVNGVGLALQTSGTDNIIMGSYRWATGSGNVTDSAMLSTGFLAIGAGSTERMRITSAGNVGIGTSIPTSKLETAISTSGTASAVPSIVAVINQGNSYTAKLLLSDGTTSSSLITHTGANIVAGQLLGLGVNNTNQVNIDGNGRLLVGHTIALSGGRAQVYSTNAEYSHQVYQDYSSGTGNFIEFLRTTGTFGSVATVVGTIRASTTNASYNTSSDYRLKENIAPMTGALAKVQQLKPVTYKWKVDGSDGQGFIAHELQEVVPECVTGEKDGEQMQGIDTSFLVATLTAAIQEQQAIITQLQADVAALKGAK